MHAKVKLNEYTKKKYNEFTHIIIHTCTEEKEDFFSLFGDIFNPKNDKDTKKDMINDFKKYEK
jgi:hypothetical protein